MSNFDKIGRARELLKIAPPRRATKKAELDPLLPDILDAHRSGKSMREVKADLDAAGIEVSVDYLYKLAKLTASAGD